MTTAAFSNPTPDIISVGGDILYPNPGKGCFTCIPPYAHTREWIPDPQSSERKGRTLVLCFDGTGDSFDDDNSNVVQFLTMLMKDDPTKQLVYYQAGIGTYTRNMLKTPMIEALTKLRDKMLARSLGDHIKDGYGFLMQNYRLGDKICIFGFSRGAFTARALAGMIQKVGLLPSHNFEQLPFAYAMYKRQDENGLRQSLLFKRAFSIDIRVNFLGVWDTVESVGWTDSQLPFCSSNNAIQYFRHALALDERRVKFIPTFWGGGYEPEEKDCMVHEFERHVNGLHVTAADVEEVFFAGAHCDVGGGSVLNGERNSLARIPLRWMIRECFKVKTGIIFDAHMLRHEVGLDIGSGPTFTTPQPLPSTAERLTEAKPDPKSKSKDASWRESLKATFRWILGKPTRLCSSGETFEPVGFTSNGEPREELADALSPIYDQLERHIYWKFMELIPWVIRRNCTDLNSLDISWIPRFVLNRGRGRVVYRLGTKHTVMAKVHRSVKARIQAKGPNGEESYLPKIRFPIDGQVRCLKREEWLATKPTHFQWVD